MNLSWKKVVFGFFGPSVFKKSHLSHEEVMKTYNFLKIELVCELKQKGCDCNISMGRNENFIRQMSALCNICSAVPYIILNEL